MHQQDLLLLTLLAAVGALLVLSRLSRIAYPIVLIVGGIVLGLIPGVPSVQMAPDFILLLVLPPLVFYAAMLYQARRLWENIGSISLLALGLLIVTTAGVASVAHLFIGLPWGAAFALGAVLSPTDPLAATSITAQLHVPRHVTGVIEGESLVNDGAALIIYGTAVTAVVSGHFSLPQATLRFPVSVIGGIIIGLLVAWLISRLLLRRLGRGYHKTVLVLITAYITYLCADAAGVSGVLAAVSGGIYIGRRMPLDDAATDRIAGHSFFEVLVFLVNALVFTVMGLQFPMIIENISARPFIWLALWAVAINLTVIGLRLAWTLAFARLVFRLDPGQRHRRVRQRWRQSLIIGWGGMRGAVSLAAALAIPLTLADGTPFPGRDLILFFTVAVIFATVVVQGLTLPFVIRSLHLDGGNSEYQTEIRRARRLGAQAALEKIEELRQEQWLPDSVADPLREVYTHRDYALTHGNDVDNDAEIDYQARYDALIHLRRELINVERSVLLRLNNNGEISDDAMRRVERDLDLEESQTKY